MTHKVLICRKLNKQTISHKNLCQIIDNKEKESIILLRGVSLHDIGKL